ncbi:MAG: hypothetical protein HOH79_02210 [Euryarchaeota archaeon]|nr:hypothetical protein [Euryarchaeota archaeon]
MGETRGELSVEMRRFNSLDIARPFVYRFLGILFIYLVLFAGLLSFLSESMGFSQSNISLGSSLLAAIGLVFIGSIGAYFIYLKSPMLQVPLAVNMNHPFMDDLGLGAAVVMVKFSDGTWGDVGEGRVRLTVDELIGGSILIRDDDTYAPIGHFSSLPETHPVLKRYVMLINQAIALRDAVNGTEDSIESAREREQQDSGLLERSWLEEQDSIEIEPEGLISKFRRE